MSSFVRALFAAVLPLLLLSAPSAGVAQAPPAACAPRTFEGSVFTVCRFDAGKDELRLIVKDASGKPYRRLSRLAQELGDAASVRFAMNAGMFDADGAPIGLYVERGKTVKALNTRDGFGNFHMKPNGVLWVGAGGDVHVTTTDDFATAKPDAQWATQSGPMLVIDGQLHPAFSPDGDSRYVRNGVGVSDSRTAFFVISDEEVSFGKFARFFRDELKTRDALYFDGAVSSLWAPSINRMDAARDLGPLVVVTSP